MDKLDRAIADKEREVRTAEHLVREAEANLAVLRAQLEAFREAARLRPLGQQEETGRRGRQPGAISKEWREVLHVMTLLDRLGYDQIQELAKGQGITADAASVRDRVRSFVNRGYLEGNATIGFSVTQDAINRFGFEQPPVASSEDDYSAVRPDLEAID